MKVNDIKIISSKDYCELHANAKFETHWVWGDEPFPLWYRFPIEYRDFLSTENGDPFVAAFLAPAMALGEPLEIDTPVSKKLLTAIPKIQSIYKCWDNKLSQIEVKASIRDEVLSLDDSPPQNIGLFFSLGVDSSYSLLKNIRNHPKDDESISHLIIVEGFDIDYQWEKERFPPLLANINKVAKEYNKLVIPVTTNLTDLSDRIVDWVRLYHGAAKATIALALSSMLKRVYIAAGQTYDRLIPQGIHSFLDPLWSNELVSFIHDGLEAKRLDKIRDLASSSVILKNLRVCTTSNITDAYNCGVCEKCLRTMIGLHILGLLQKCKVFPHTIDIELIRRLSELNPVAKQNFRELLDELIYSKKDLAIKSALEECLSRDMEKGSEIQ